MKRVGHIHEWMLRTDNIIHAMIKASRGHRSDRRVARVMAHREEYAERLRDMLAAENVALKPDNHFTRYESASGKTREITSQHFFPNKVLDWLITNALIEYGVVSRPLVDGCVGSIPKRGVAKGQKLVMKGFNIKGAKYILQTDIRHFFQNIDTGILMHKLSRKIKDPKFLSLLGKLLSVGNGGTGKGLALGYYSSQWLSNFYLCSFDQSILQNFKPAVYIRYVDDIVVFMTNRRKARRLLDYMREQATALGLEIKPNWSLFARNDRPLDFLGFRFYTSWDVRMRKRNFYRLKRITKHLAQQLSSKGKLCVDTCRIWVSLYGWLIHIRGGRSVYLKQLKPLIPKKRILKAIGTCDSVYAKTGRKLAYC